MPDDNKKKKEIQGWFVFVVVTASASLSSKQP